MRQAIMTKYVAPTNTKGARIKAEASAGSLFTNYNEDLSIEENHRKAAYLLAKKFGWERYNSFIGGWMPKEQGCVFVSVEKEKK